MTAIGPENLPRLSEISLDGRSLAFTLILSVLSGLLFGSIPVLRYVPSRQAAPLLGTVRTASVSRERQRGRNLLVVAQVAMALVLLISAVLMIRTFNAMRNVDPGFSDPTSLQVMRISIPETARSRSADGHCGFRTTSRTSSPRFPGFPPQASPLPFL